MPASPGSRSRLALLALLGGSTCIGFAPILVRYADTGPSATAFYRVLGALPLLWLWVALGQGATPGLPGSPLPKSVRTLAPFTLAGLFFAADLSIWHWSLRFTTVATSTLLTNLAPIFVSIMAWFFFGERLTLWFAAALIIAMLGACLVVGVSGQSGTRPLLGNILAVVAAICFGAYLLAVKHLRKKYQTPVIMAYSSIFSCPSFAAIALASGDSMVPSSSRGWLPLVGLALVCHVGGQTLITYGFGHLPASISSLSLLWQPVVAAAVAWLCFGEYLGWTQIVGGSIVLVGIVLASRSMSPQPAAMALGHSSGDGDSGCNHSSAGRS